MNRAFRIVVVLVLAVFATWASPANPVDPISPATQRIVGTVRAVDTKARVIELVTGVGYAARVTQLRVADDCLISIPWAADQLSGLTAGTFARVQFVAGPVTARAPDNLVAVTIDAFDAKATEDVR
jgi:hypothetical protein